jgi:hypothetical protein
MFIFWIITLNDQQSPYKSTLFLAVMPRVIVPMCAYFTLLKGKPTGLKFIDSTSINVCHNI